jgi:hypothetical protein
VRVAEQLAHHQPTAGSQHARHLLGGELGIEPVPRLRHQHRVDAVIGKRDLFGGAQ